MKNMSHRVVMAALELRLKAADDPSNCPSRAIIDTLGKIHQPRNTHTVHYDNGRDLIIKLDRSSPNICDVTLVNSDGKQVLIQGVESWRLIQINRAVEKMKDESELDRYIQNMIEKITASKIQYKKFMDHYPRHE